MNTTHIHEVIFLVQDNEGVFTPETLVTAIAEKWGDDVGFMSCSGVPTPKEEALQFILDRNKVVVNTEGKIEIHPSMKMCDSHLR
ncbi:YecH family protein [Flammeovirga yaeyamensis]|uniref:YecH family protein n=1 Tax=Flammeovirga yaeyamensis TaxID=367791 RepID=A0AAX1NEV9_9BACT|nr:MULTISPECIES: DUF2492 family protein [Flammeovirga]ANQ51473.1 DUF2492 family protein [Flammeovirga sp. MY04]MBB3696805.1 putative metal-binding protein [Flammeovirga yaeyamensis]NMF33471.1 DUF2492 family protein [Flammeovirga yaeyamensis]QWG05255.1 YecH family protein [Flammeovirga yaeyamensis]